MLACLLRFTVTRVNGPRRKSASSPGGIRFLLTTWFNGAMFSPDGFTISPFKEFPSKNKKSSASKSHWTVFNVCGWSVAFGRSFLVNHSMGFQSFAKLFNTCGFVVKLGWITKYVTVKFEIHWKVKTFNYLTVSERNEILNHHFLIKMSASDFLQSLENNF